MRLSLESQTGPRLSGAAPVAPELSRAEAVGELVVSWLLMGLLSFLLTSCSRKREGWGKWNDVDLYLQVVGFLCFVLMSPAVMLTTA